MSKEVDWREFNVHNEHTSKTQNDNNDDEEEEQQPVDIFAPKEEDVYVTKDYNFTETNTTIKLREQADYDKSTGVAVWRGAEILCKYILQHPNTIKEKRICELGSGVGLCGIVSAKILNASSVLLTDGDQVVLRNLRYNIELNELDDIAKCCQLIWGKERAIEFEKEYGKQDVILASDCVYMTASVRPLFETVSQLLSHDDGVFLVANTCASQSTLDVIDVGKEFGFVASRGELWYHENEDVEQFKKDPVYVFRRRSSLEEVTDTVEVLGS